MIRLTAPPGVADVFVAPALPVGGLWLVGHVALRRVPRVAALWQVIVEELTRPWA